MTLTVIIAMLCITALLVVALAQGIDGALLASGFTIIGGLGGYEIKVLSDKRKEKK